MKLSDRDRLVLKCIEHRASCSLSEISKIAKIREHTLRYTVSKLKERGIIVGYAPFINVYPLGYTDFTLFFALSSGTKKKHEKVIERLKNGPGVSWMGKVGGAYHYGLAIMARYIDEVFELQASLGKEFGAVFGEKVISVRRSMYAFGRKYFAPKSASSPILSFHREKVHRDRVVPIDEEDHYILSGLANLTYSSNRDLARQLGLTHTTLDRRIARLEERGIISGFIYRFNFSQMGLLSFRLLLETKSFDSDFSKRLFEFCKKHPHILHFFESAGSWDFELGVEVYEAEDISEVTTSLYQNFGDFPV